MQNYFSSLVKIYQCLALTVIAIALVIIVLRTPVPYTYDNLKSGKVKQEQIPITRVTGSVDVDNTVTVEVER